MYIHTCTFCNVIYIQHYGGLCRYIYLLYSAIYTYTFSACTDTIYANVHPSIQTCKHNTSQQYTCVHILLSFRITLYHNWVHLMSMHGLCHHDCMSNLAKLIIQMKSLAIGGPEKSTHANCISHDSRSNYASQLPYVNSQCNCMQSGMQSINHPAIPYWTCCQTQGLGFDQNG